MRHFTMVERCSRPITLEVQLYDAVNPFIEICVHEGNLAFAEAIQLSPVELDTLIENLTKLRAEVRE